MTRSREAWALFLATRVVGLAVDVAVVAAAYGAALVLRFDFRLPHWGLRATASAALVTCAAYLVALVLCGCYRIAWRRFSLTWALQS